jgi:hypothetical protein
LRARTVAATVGSQNVAPRRKYIDIEACGRPSARVVPITAYV